MRRFFTLLLLGWAIGFAWFAAALPQPAGKGRTDAVVVLTGGEGRIARGFEALDRKWARRLLVSGVHRDVKPGEFAAEYRVPAARMKCCVTLDFEAVDTRSNGLEVAQWIASNRFASVRLVTTDWHMRRAAFEIGRRLPKRIVVLADAVPSKPSLRTLFLEYHKLLARRASQLWEA